MPLTVNSSHWLCDEETAARIASEMGLKKIVTAHRWISSEQRARLEWEKENPAPVMPPFSGQRYDRDGEFTPAYDKWCDEHNRVYARWNRKWETKLAHLRAEGKIKDIPRPSIQMDRYEAWEDGQTMGGMCRITWFRGVAWISNHSGYGEGTTEIAKEKFAACCEAANQWLRNPRVYGVVECEESLERNGFRYERDGD